MKWLMPLLVVCLATVERSAVGGVENGTTDDFISGEKLNKSETLKVATWIRADLGQEDSEEESSLLDDLKDTKEAGVGASSPSNKRELRNMDASRNLNKASPLDPAEEQALIAQMMSGTESPYNPTPSRLPVIQKLSSKPRTKVPKNDSWSDTFSLEDLLDVYSASRLSMVWNRTGDLQVTPQCFNDMTVFLKGLRKGELWALKSEYLSCLRNKAPSYLNFKNYNIN